MWACDLQTESPLSLRVSGGSRERGEKPRRTTQRKHLPRIEGAEGLGTHETPRDTVALTQVLACMRGEMHACGHMIRHTLAHSLYTVRSHGTHGHLKHWSVMAPCGSTPGAPKMSHDEHREQAGVLGSGVWGLNVRMSMGLHRCAQHGMKMEMG